MHDTLVIDAEELRDAARGLLASADAAGADAAALWTSMQDAGWLGLGVSVEHGGLGQPIGTVVALLEELGRRPRAHPLIAASAAAMVLDALAADGNARARALLDAALAGAALIVYVPLASRPVVPAAVAGGARLGEVAHAAVATHLLFEAADAAGGTGLFCCPVAGGALRVESCAGWDGTRQWASVDIERAFDDGDLLARAAGGAAAALARGRAVFDLAMAADAQGGAAQIFEATLAYMKQRVQFGRPIASFQALKHRAADLATELAAARAAVARACARCESGERDAVLHAALARSAAGAAYCTIAEEAIQMHGGIGFTWEHECHRYLNRARSAESVGGTRAERLDAAAAALIGAVRGDS